jgi:Asp-tRNA(Asn)/Glu-tRNA(Gln) amidotransferase A subunit family amidase
LTSDALEIAIAAYDEWEPQLRAFAWFDPEQARARAAGRPSAGPLDGLPVGVKDIFDTAGIPTEYGSAIFAGRIPTDSAVAVSRLEAAGAVMFGKTVTAELAYYEPGPTTNPWDPARTPGGSSMGSAAAVAAGVVPLALGSQTNGSLIRPAAFCGIVGFKPSAGRLPGDGVLSFSASLDQVGVFARTVADAAQLTAVLADEPPSEWLSTPPSEPTTLGVVRTPEWDQISDAQRAAFDLAVAAVRERGGSVIELEMPPSLAHTIGVHRTIMAVEASRSIGPLVADQVERCSVQLRELLDHGAAASQESYDLALALRETAIEDFDRWAAGVDALLTPATLGEAPPLASTGDPVCSTRWTLVGAPAIALPSALSPNGLPLAVQLVGQRGRDRDLLGIAGWLERLLPAIGDPPRGSIPRASPQLHG